LKPAELYILNQPEKYRDMLLHIIAVIEHTTPEVTLEYKWGIPYFYYQKKPFCYLNASHKNQFVDVGFAKGFQLKDNQEFLIADNGRNTIKSLRYYSLEKIDNTILVAVVEEAKKLY
jgi:hypothetical protein